MATETYPLARQLISDVLDSFEKLEIVLYLDRSQQPATAEVLAAHLTLSEDRTAEALVGLVADQLVAATGAGYGLVTNSRWQPHVRQLVALYQADRMEVVTLMSNAALERMRTRASRAFADAFVIGSRKNKGERDE